MSSIPPDATREQLWKNLAPLLNYWFNDLRRSHPDEARDIEELLVKRDREPGLEPALLKELAKHTPSRKRRSELIRGLVSSIFLDEGFPTDTHAHTRSQDFPLEPRTRQRFYNTEFSHLFPPAAPGKDARLSIRTSIAAPRVVQQSPRLQFMGNKARESVREEGTMQHPLSRELANTLRLTEPTVVGDIANLQREALACAQKILGPNGEPRTELGAALMRELCVSTDTLPMLHANLTGILAGKWFQSRRPATRATWLQKTHRRIITREDAAQAFQILADMLGNEDAACAIFEQASAPFVMAGDWTVGFLLNERIYLSQVPTEAQRGAFIGNMAAALRRSGHHDEALVCLDRSIQHHRRAGDDAGLAVALRDLAEALWRTERDQAEALVDEVVTAAGRLQGEDRANALYQLVAMYERLGEADLLRLARLAWEAENGSALAARSE